MIIIGYQGIGKSTVAGRNSIIDLESSNFYDGGKRPDNWAVYYANIAKALSKQGYIVFISSHKEVRDQLKDCGESIYVIYPTLDLKNYWIEKLRVRFEFTKLEKDYRAWQNADQNYIENIRDLMNSGYRYFAIEDIGYRLADIVDYLVAFDLEWNNRNFKK